jgi:CBS domain-containing protein
MKARNLASPEPSVASDAPAAEAAAILGRHDVRAVLVVNARGQLVGVVSDSSLLRQLLPSYVEEAEPLARVLEEGAADLLWQRLEGLFVGDLIPEDQEVPQVEGRATLIEVALVMVRSKSPLVGVLEDGRLVGGITIDHLLSHLLGRR